MKKILAFNWKMNPSSYSEAERLAKIFAQMTKGAKNTEVIISPPLQWLDDLARKLKGGIKFGSQDIFWEEKGAYTGEVSPEMLKKSGIQYAIVGHSERRRILGETDAMVNKKLLAGLRDGLKVILCIGEDLKIRRRGKKAVGDFIKSQLEKDLKGILNLKSKILNLVIAYEPVWAIGTGKNDTPEDAVQIIRFIKHILNSKFSAKGGSASGGKIQNSKVLYGGSVTGKNIQNFIKYKEIDGALVGGASLKPGQFKNIIK